MKPKQYVYAGEPVPDLNEAKYTQFRLHLEESILFSLEKRNLLTHAQFERCVTEIKKCHTKDHRKHRG